MAKWSAMLRTQLAVLTLVLAVNAAGTTWAGITYQPDSRGVSTFLFGDCTGIARLKTTLHVLLKVLSGLLLGTGNFTACSCSRRQAAVRPMTPMHAVLRWTLVSPASRTCGTSTGGGWSVIGVMTMLLHLLEVGWWQPRRATFGRRGKLVGDRPLSHRGWWVLPAGWGDTTFDLSPIYSMQTNWKNLTRLEPKGCISEYLDPLSSTRITISGPKLLNFRLPKSVICFEWLENLLASRGPGQSQAGRSQSQMVWPGLGFHWAKATPGRVKAAAFRPSQSQNITNGSSLLHGWMSEWDSWDSRNHWMCSAHDPGYTSLGDEWAVRVGPNSLDIPNPSVDYCLMGEAADNEGRCGLHHSMHIMIVVCACTAVECILILWTAFYFRRGGKKKRERTLVTMGDAISAFLVPRGARRAYRRDKLLWRNSAQWSRVDTG
ncbi:hypothetical protein B0H17DRAFT_1139580 [Mycena rosella]|uniref:DUF6536 domain-containing protein n=1 Tax=Mycena rosella TaxID=1033263 RepID=A0AAD7D3W6_MYCRO|nr:hypothetical protein B0H17DRAFT_1139580 [Mycena rosella]